MSPRISKSMADKLIKGGAKLREKDEPVKAAPAAPPETDSKAITATLEVLVQSLQQQTIASQMQLELAQESIKQLTAMVQAISTKNPVRLKPVRDMERGSPTYLLTEYIDMIPVTHRKLDS